MAIRIQRNENANAITFVGSSQPAYWNNCLEGEVNEVDSNRVNVINTVRTTDSDSKVYEFFAVPYTEFQTALGTAFNDAQECADYITAQANATAIGIIEFGATDVVDFARDATNTTILASTGHSYPVNSIKAVAQADGTISIKENVDNGSDLMRTIRKQNITFGGQVQAQQLTPVVNALNALFTVTPVGTGADDRFISNTYDSSSPSTVAFGDVTIANNVATKGTNSDSEFDDGFYTTSNPISEAGEYYQFDNTGNDPLKKMVIGLMKTSEITSDAVLTDNVISGEDMDLAVRLKPNFTYEHSPYGAVIENGFFSNPQRSDLYRAGIDDDGRLFISHYDTDAAEWQVIVRSALVIVEEEYSLVIFLKQENAVVTTAVTTKTIYDGPVMTYYYIESPDGDFYYPLFQTEAEANQADTNNGGSGASHQHTFADETPSSQIWYMPATGGTHAGSSAPSNTASITYNVISTGADANYVPPAFTISDLTVNENTAVNYQVSPAGANWTTTVSGLPLNLSLSGNNIVGTAKEVAGTNDVTPSEVSTVTVTRTNSFGSTSTTFDITIVNTTVNTTPISGFTHVTGSTTLVDTDTLAAGSAVEIDDDIEDGNRFHISNEFFNANVIPALSNVSDTVFIGFKDPSSASWGSIGLGDFLLGWRFRRTSSTVIQATRGGVGITPVSNNHAISGGTIGYDFYLSNKTGVLEATADAASNNKDNELSIADGGSFAFHTSTSTGSTVSRQIVIATNDTEMDITETNLSEYALPVPPTNQTSWSKALDFSGGSEHAKQVSNSMIYQPLQMNGLANLVSGHSTQGYTSNSSSSRPWATAVVFKSDGYSGNQMIWNQGEGSSSGNDNIFVNVTASGNVHFGWGREGTGYNQCLIATGISSSNWYGVYIAHSGERLGGNNATAANLADCFDIRLMSSADSFGSLSANLSTSSNWTSTGYRMDRTVAGDFTVGGRASGYNYRGKVASVVAHCLKLGVAMPDATEIKLIITDPTKWETDYLIGNTYRRPTYSSNSTNYQKDTSLGFSSTQMWLMGDSSHDAFPNIRNNQRPVLYSYTSMDMINMVSNDIETVTIPGLT